MVKVLAIVPLAQRGHGQKSSRRQPPGVLNIVGVGNQAPLAGTSIMLASHTRKRVTRLQDLHLCSIRGIEVELCQLVVESFVFTQIHRYSRPQRYALGAEQRVLMTYALDDALKRIAFLVTHLFRDVR